MLTPSSLRAKRGNPAFGAVASGLPRRCAPRNDSFLRAFASARETNFLLSSREDVWAQGHDLLRVDLRK